MSEVNNVGSKVLNTLDVGSGLDVVQLARDLTDAEGTPKTESLNKEIAASEASVSAYGLVKFQVSVLQAAFEQLNDADELATSTGASSASSKVAFASVSGNAQAGAYDISVSQLAQSQRSISDQFVSKTATLNSGTDFELTLTEGSSKLGTFEEKISEAALRTALASGSITATDGSGNSISVTQAEVNSAGGTSSGGETLDGYAAALQSKSSGSAFQFTISVNGSEGVTYTQKAAGTHSLVSASGSIVAGVPGVAPVTGVAAKYSFTATASETTTLVLGDGINTVSVDSASYTSVADQVTAIKSASGYEKLLFTVAENSGAIELSYKKTGAISNAPTFTGSGSAHTMSNPITGVTAVNSPVVTRVSVTDTTPEGIVAAINASDTNIKANILDTGSSGANYRIVLSGATGSNGVFSVSSSPDLGFGDSENTLQLAQDAVVDFEGISLTRETNDISDMVEGATISLLETTDSAIRLNITKDRSTLKTNIQTVVNAYNDLGGLFDTLTSVDSEDELGGSLADDSSGVRYLKNQIRESIFGNSSTGSGSINAMRDLGVSIDRKGAMTFDESKFDATLLSSYDDISMMLTAGTSDQNLFSTASKGLAQDVATALENLTDTDGIITTRANNSSEEVKTYKEELVKLEARLETVYNRYLTQFGAMESLMASMDATKDYLTGQLESLSKAYDD